MKLRSKVIALLAVGTMSVGLLAGCGSSDTAEAASEETEEVSAEAAEEVAEAEEEDAEAVEVVADNNYKIAMCQQHQTNAFQIAITEAATEAADELGVDLTIFDANQDAETQISQIEQCASQGYDAILFEPVDTEGLGSAAAEAIDQGVLVMNVVSTCEGWEDIGIAAFSGGDNTTAGEEEMQQVVDLLGGEGQIAILTGPTGDSSGNARYDGYMSVLENYPDIEIVAEAACDWDTALAQSTVESWLVAYDLDAIVCENDGMAVGAANAAGENSGIVITGVDATPDGLEAIANGTMTGTVSQDAAAQGRNAIYAVVDLLNGETLETNYIITQNIWVDSSNVAEFE